jgi:hypothetical protein
MSHWLKSPGLLAWGVFLAFCADNSALPQEVGEPFILHGFQAEGTIEGSHARLVIRLRAEALTDELVRIPLRLDQCILTEQKFSGDARQYLKDEAVRDAKDERHRGGYAWYLQGKGKVCDLTLTALVPVRIVGGETQLQLTAPEAQQAVSELKIVTPGDMVAGKVLRGEQLDKPQKAGDGTQFTFARLSGPFTFSWHPRDAREREPGRLQARVFIKSRFDGTNQEFKSEARITVFSPGGTFEGFRVRLPPGAVLAGDHPGVAPVADSGMGTGQLLDVQTEAASRFGLALSLRHEAAKGPTELGRYEVVGATRQWGFATVEIDEAWQVRWPTLDPQHGERIAASELPKEFLEEMKTTAGAARGAFELFSAQSSLRVTCYRYKPRVRVEPEYVVRVDRDELRLDAFLTYVVDRVPLAQVQIEWPQSDAWEEEKAIVDQAVQSYAIDAVPGKGSKTPRRIMTVDVQSVNKFTLHLTARRKLSATDKVAFGFPVPFSTQHQVVSPRVWIQAGRDVSLKPAAESISGLSEVAETPRVPDELASLVRSPLVYQMDLGGPVRFSGALSVPPRRLAVRGEGTITIDEKQVRVRQVFTYTLEHEVLRRISLHVPDSIGKGESLKIYLDNQLIEKPQFAESPDAAKESNEVPNSPAKTMVLPTPVRPGEFTLRIEHTYPSTKDGDVSAGKSVVNVPLVMPAEGTLTENTLRVATRQGMSARLAPASEEEEPAQPWQAGDDAPTSRGGSLRLQSPEMATEVRLELDYRAQTEQSKAVIERLWLRTEFGPYLQDDRWRCHITGGIPRLRFRLPKQAEALRVTLNDEPIAVERNAQGEVLFVREEPSMPPNARHHTLEIAYQIPTGNENEEPGLEIAQPAGEVWVRQSHWELVVPEHHHLLRSPAGLTREFTWKWTGWYFARAPRQSSWVSQFSNVAGIEEGQPSGVNRYLFTTLGPLPVLRVSLISRTWLVLLASGAAFIAGALWLYVGSVRRREVWLVAAVLLVAFCLALPEQAIVLGQAASLGVAAAVGMALMKWLFATTQPASLRRRGSAVGSSFAYEKTSTAKRSVVNEAPAATPSASAPILKSTSSHSTSKAPTVASASQRAST